ncbi:hypothetical protein DFH08DRAFT_816726 [Mycena albidolilacea]|uniref:Uncharacterized protein n=1 Tax=Mycena albidolilacea TaxID=1033008 RepID=A0AAD6ZKN1_9AGAR|nr:hypothetical protein DFH08DRAFT_816726 [Mycena albidolilacea]
MSNALLNKTGKALFKRYLEQYSPSDPMYEYTEQSTALEQLGTWESKMNAKEFHELVCRLSLTGLIIHFTAGVANVRFQRSERFRDLYRQHAREIAYFAFANRVQETLGLRLGWTRTSLMARLPRHSRRLQCPARFRAGTAKIRKDVVHVRGGKEMMAEAMHRLVRESVTEQNLTDLFGPGILQYTLARADYMPEITITCVVSNPETMSKFTQMPLPNCWTSCSASQANTITAEAVS